MQIGRLHVRLTFTRQYHSQTKWPDDSYWQTDYFESDRDLVKPEQDTWVTPFETMDKRSILIRHRAVTRFLIKFEVVYRSFWFEVGNCTHWKR